MLSRAWIHLSIALSTSVSASFAEPLDLRQVEHLLYSVNSPQNVSCLSVGCESNAPDFMKDALRPPVVRVSGVQGLPNYSRVICLSDPKAKKVKILYEADGVLQIKEIARQSILSPNARASTKDELNAFLKEARFQVRLARRYRDADSLPAFSSMLNRIESGLDCIEKNRSKAKSQWNEFVGETQKNFSLVPGNKLATLEKFKSQIFQAMNPDEQGRDLEGHTLYVPVSMQWFRSDPQLASYFDQNWMHSDPSFDLKIRGNSGEGMSQVKSDGVSDFDFYISKLIDLKQAILKMKNTKLLQTPEFQWLSQVDASYGKKFDRMIFVHERTWDSKSTGWQDFIPIDQRFSSIASNPILSVLIHETNVNSYLPIFLPQDTHSPNEKSYALWSCLGKTTTLSKINGSVVDQARAMGVEPQLGSVYLGILVPKLAAKTGCQSDGVR